MDLTPEASDQRLYAEMQRRLRRFQGGDQTLRELTAGLQTAFEHLQTPEQSWRDEFWGLWSELEYTYDQCQEKASGLTGEEYKHVVGTAKMMDTMLAAKRTWSKLEVQTLRAVINNQRPELLRDLESALGKGLEPKLVREIRTALRDEIAENGTTEGALNDWGEACEDFMWRIEPPPSQDPMF